MIMMHPDVIDALDTPDGLQTALQTAIRLEHATIPPYLYAMFSIKPDDPNANPPYKNPNRESYNLILSVVLEEMLHMSLACNILNAIGGSPVIDEPGFIPNYPTHLPGAVEHQLMVPLAPFSRDLVNNVFMVIEEPEEPKNPPAKRKHFTIGDFYDMLKQKLSDAGSGIWVDDHSKQVEGYLPGLTKVYNFDTAAAAIDLIREQGEGTSTDPMEPGSKTEPAHYYRYAEIYYGGTLIGPNLNPPPNPTPAQKYIYGDPAIPFDPKGVYPTVENPKSAQYPAGSQARYACDTFNYTYTTLLKCLHSAFNGNPAQLGDAIGIMESLKEQAVDLMTFAANPANPTGPTAGPSFEYQPTNPWPPTPDK